MPRRVDGAVVRFAPAWCRYYPSTYEPAKRAFLETYCRPGTVVVDAGAHIGLYTVTMALAVGPSGCVVSFEPTPATRDALERTVRLNGCEGRVRVRPEAVTDEDGATVCFHDTGAAMSNANRVVFHARGVDDIEVPTTTIDAAVGDREVSCLKIDVEGGELQALRGAAGTITREQPAIALEVHPGVLGEDGMRGVWDILAGAGYTMAAAGVVLDVATFLGRRDGFEVQCTPTA